MVLLEAAAIWQQLIQQLQQTSWLEWFGFISTIACIYLAAKENIWNWPISILSIVISAILYFESHLFGDFALQFYFLFTAFYGWWFWLKKKKENEKPIVRIKSQDWMMIVGIVALLTLVLGYLLDKYTPTNVPYEDGFCTAVSLVAQIMLTRKILENWILWIIVDICYVPLLIYKNLNVYAILYAVLVVIAVKGYLDWRKTYRGQKRGEHYKTN
ncbi:nicotinamide riboside transporter PnuC [Pedobacter xixiisoli]|uniref:Nicotinamide riboside transporter PnuC n=1 Tax=Pedobacter xixiisoli TaxID=1476464 RepID=A0A286AEG0_9SPHI|nr:nicotinamide riboside transporter PnuC [Pedobacter xixiisoli]SOD20284.1 nicotinamide mononucleotide transporter [Pedobacter xixiisoli]